MTKQKISKKISKTVAENVSKLRKKSGLSAKILAKTCGIPIPSVYNVESGNFTPTIPTLVALSNYFKIPISKLIGEEKKDFSDEKEACYLKWHTLNSLSKKDQKVIQYLAEKLKKEK